MIGKGYSKAKIKPMVFFMAWRSGLHGSEILRQIIMQEDCFIQKSWVFIQ